MENTSLVIDKRGSYVKKTGNRFIVQNQKEKSEYSADKINQLIFISPSAISFDAVNLAIEKNIDIVYLDYRGRPFARTYRPTLGGTTLTRRRQLESYFSKKGGEISKLLIEGKIKSQINFLKSLAKDRKNDTALHTLINGWKLSLELNNLKGTISEIRNTLLGFEGSTAARYFQGLGLATGYSGRNPKGKDPFNICLNYAYGMLYSEAERACILAGLDPYLGFFHTDRYGKPSMVLDIMELFRVAVADRAIVTLFNRKEINEKDFEKIGNSILSQPGRKKIIEAVIKRLNTEIKYKGKSLTLKEIILSQTREIAAFLLGHKKDFKPFVYE